MHMYFFVCIYMCIDTHMFGCVLEQQFEEATNMFKRLAEDQAGQFSKLQLLYNECKAELLEVQTNFSTLQEEHRSTVSAHEGFCVAAV